ncbi:GDP-L-fucose synthase [Halioxenophilus sp. WMMB6]|uniref:GDP-L-fucose synthase n=1 Tax=Halioxenophilus sp. WMMB6 TaxID=3073815 RepID=UPI00295F2A1C|nr:GDP-L-fucose synthase [Halioxenophilus sp. WMMB6]
MLDKQAKIYIAGHRGMVGSAIHSQLTAAGFQNLVVRTHAELDLINQAAVSEFFQAEKPEYVYLAAAKVGGIHANNSYPAEFIYQNLMMEANIIHSAYQTGVKRLLFLGSSCIYPKLAKQPMAEGELLSGKLEPTNEPYALAKIAGIKLCESYHRQYGCDYRSVMPTNLYGPNDNFHPENSHVIPALLRRFHEAKLAAQPVVEIWGSGKPMREFLHVDDMASACVHVMALAGDDYWGRVDPMCSHVNIGFGSDVTIAELAHTVKAVVGFDGDITFNTEMPDGTPKKLMDSSLLQSLGWQPKFGLAEGLANAYEWYLANQSTVRG